MPKEHMVELPNGQTIIIEGEDSAGNPVDMERAQQALASGYEGLQAEMANPSQQALDTYNQLSQQGFTGLENEMMQSDPMLAIAEMANIQRGREQQANREQAMIDLLSKSGRRPIGENPIFTDTNANEGGLEGFRQGFYYAGADNAPELAARVMKQYPGGEVEIGQDPNTGDAVVMLRKPGEADFKVVNGAGGVMDDLGAGARWLMSGENIGNLLGEVGGAYIGRRLAPIKPEMTLLQKGGARIIRGLSSALGAGAGAGVGSAGDEVFDVIDGTNAETVDEVLQRNANVAAMAGLGDLAGRGVMVVGRGIVSNPLTRKLYGATSKIDPGIHQANKFAQKFGFPTIMAGDVSELGRRNMYQAVLSPSVQRFQQGRAIKALEGMRNFINSVGNPKNLSTATLDDAIHRWEKDLADGLLEPNLGPMAASRPGVILGDGLTGYELMANELISRRAAELNAKNIGSDALSFKISGLPQMVREIKKGVVARVRKNISEDDFDLVGAVDEGDDRFVKITQLDSRLQRMLNMLSVLKVDVTDIPGGKSHVPSSALEQMRQIRTLAYNVMTDDKLFGYQKNIASDVYGMIRDAWQNPVGGSAEVRGLFRRLNKSVAMKERVLDRANIRSLTGMSPTELGTTLLNVHRPESVRLAKKLLSRDPTAWGAVQQGYVKRLMSQDFGTTINMLESIDPDTVMGRNLLLPKDMQASVLEWAKAMRRFHRSPLVRTAEAGLEDAAAAIEIVNKGQNLSLLREHVQALGGIGSPAVNDLGAGVLTWAMNQAIERTDDGSIALAGRRVVKILDDLKKTGALEEIFTPEQLAHTEDLTRLLSVLPDRLDMSDSMAISNTAGQAQSGQALTGGIYHFLGARRKMMANWVTAKLYMSATRNELMGLPQVQADFTDQSAIRILTSILTRTLQKEEPRAKKKYGDSEEVMNPKQAFSNFKVMSNETPKRIPSILEQMDMPTSL